ncbi:hypothetical protein WR25_21376 isoform B [Diploscapter pachys]|uniref:Neurotransmitter-gated ion-channel ligand-binding domain-containing protein n=1 Tax=Diploscapter pachys TaxID=2018661 RepID=A0A2A2L703_9BILA|nr:hypothetical protein WR25_21376 isoform A [Diploscapter pachys]PAV81828.1 hypothetical protein WR25_21376 isoform B [Diploscapter pachys]
MRLPECSRQAIAVAAFLLISSIHVVRNSDAAYLEDDGDSHVVQFYDFNGTWLSFLNLKASVKPTKQRKLPLSSMRVKAINHQRSFAIERKQKEWLKTKEKEEVEMKENKVEAGEATTKMAEVLETPTAKPEKLTTVGQKSVQAVEEESATTSQPVPKIIPISEVKSEEVTTTLSESIMTTTQISEKETKQATVSEITSKTPSSSSTTDETLTTIQVETVTKSTEEETKTPESAQELPRAIEESENKTEIVEEAEKPKKVPKTHTIVETKYTPIQHYELPEENVIHLIYTKTGKRLGTDYEYKYKEIKEKVKKAKERFDKIMSGNETEFEMEMEMETETEAEAKERKFEPDSIDAQVYSLLDDSGRISPNFEVRDEMLFNSSLTGNISYEETGIHVASFDTLMLESEEMLNLDKWNMTDLREILSNVTLLEQQETNSHTDYGGSYILPVLSTVKYDNSTVPLAFSDIPVNVLTKINILYLANFNSELMEYSIDLELEMSWFDIRLSNNYTKPIRIREKQIIDKIWRPDPYFVNSKYSYFHHVSFPNFRMRVRNDGLVTYTMRVTSVCNCFMLFCLYPHDQQSCDMKISSIAYPASFVRFVWASEPVRFASPVFLPELHIHTLRTTNCSVEGKLIPSSCLSLIFDLERDGSRFIAEKYIPSTLAMMFAWVAPYVPYNYEEVRIITPITVNWRFSENALFSALYLLLI